MKYLSLFVSLILTGCASGPPIEKYVAKEGDPVISLATLAISKRGGTTFFVKYANENNECNVMQFYKADYSISVPKNKIFSVGASYYSSEIFAGRELTTSCDVPSINVMADENAAYSFRFRLEESRCSISVNLVKREGNIEKIVKDAELQPMNPCNGTKAMSEKK